MRNVTIRVDEQTLRRARIRALQEGTSLNGVVREFLASYAGGDEEMEARQHLISLANDAAIDGRLDEREWVRDDLYKDRIRWPRS